MVSLDGVRISMGIPIQRVDSRLMVSGPVKRQSYDHRVFANKFAAVYLQ